MFLWFRTFVTAHLDEALFTLAYVVTITVDILDGHKECIETQAQIARFIEVSCCEI